MSKIWTVITLFDILNIIYQQKKRKEKDSSILSEQRIARKWIKLK